MWRSHHQFLQVKWTHVEKVLAFAIFRVLGGLKKCKQQETQNRMGQISRSEFEYCTEIININWKLKQGQHGYPKHQDTNTQQKSGKLHHLLVVFRVQKNSRSLVWKTNAFKPPRYCNPSACRRWSWPYVTRMKAKNIRRNVDVEIWNGHVDQRFGWNVGDDPPPKKKTSNLSKCLIHLKIAKFDRIFGVLKDNLDVSFGCVFVNPFLVGQFFTHSKVLKPENVTWKWMEIRTDLGNMAIFRWTIFKSSGGRTLTS